MKIFSYVFFATGIFAFAACEPAPTANVETESEVPLETEADRTMTQLEEAHLLFRDGYADSVNQGLITDETFKGSSRRVATGKVGETTVSINYGSPGKRGREIWNGLVVYDQVWATGAHWATAVTFDKDVNIEGTEVKAGTYGFFTIPGRDAWTLILNKTYDQHLADDYTEGDDVVRLNVKPEKQIKTTERLTYSVEPTEGNKGKISMAWDDIKVSLPFEVI